MVVNKAERIKQAVKREKVTETDIFCYEKSVGSRGIDG